MAERKLPEENTQSKSRKCRRKKEEIKPTVETITEINEKPEAKEEVKTPEQNLNKINYQKM